MDYVPIIFFGGLVLLMFVSLGLVLYHGYKTPCNLPPAFPNQTDADIYRKL